MNNKSTIVLLIVLGIIIFGGAIFFYFNRKNTTATPSVTEPNSSTPSTTPGTTSGTGITPHLPKTWMVGPPVSPMFNNMYSLTDIAKHLGTTDMIISILNPTLPTYAIPGGTLIKY